MKKILIIGATSSIAEHCARIWAKSNYSIFLVARNIDKLKVLSQDLKIRGASNVDYFNMDVNDIKIHSSMYDQALRVMGEIDVVLIAHGTLPDQKKCEEDVLLTIHELNTNAISTIALLTLISNDFKIKRNGVIAVISSVAGERGRLSNYIYGSAKSMLTNFTSGLRQRLHNHNVSIITILPGLIDTPMTKEFKKGFIWSTPEYISSKIIQAINGKKKIIFLPFYWGFIMFIIKNLPETFLRKFIH